MESSRRPTMMDTTLQPRPRWWLILFLVCAASGIYTGAYLTRGWVPWDAGAYAQSAERVLQGELPHLDYIETYTGGLAFLNALAFRYLGESLATPRLVLFVLFLVWIPTVYWVASQFTADWIAGGVTCLAVAWSLPTNSEGVPSWYNLFFATFGLALLLAYLRGPSPKWLFWAGLCGGFSFLAKSIGLSYVAAVLLFLVFCEQTESLQRQNAPERRKTRYAIFVGGSLGLFLILLVVLLLRRPGISAFLLFNVPSGFLACLLILNEMRLASRASSSRFAGVMHSSAIFGLGVAAPILIFLMPYLRVHAVGLLLRDLYLQASLRVSRVYMDPPEIVTTVPSLFLAGVLLAWGKLRGVARWLLGTFVVVLLALGFSRAGRSEAAFDGVFLAAYWAILPLTVAGTIVLSRAGSIGGSAGKLKREQIFLLLSMAALGSWVEFPYSSYPYFCYVAPLVLLATVALLSLFPSLPRPLLGVLFVSFLLFAVFRVTPVFLYNMGAQRLAVIKTQALALPRAGHLRVDPTSAAVYESLIPLIQEHAGTGEIYAAPDCPEVYFLAGYRNPTRDIYDFLDDQAGRKERVLELLDRHPIRVVVLNGKPFASDTVPDDLHEALAQRFPARATVGYFEIRWRP